MKVLLSYALPAFPLSALLLTFYVYLPKFYTEFHGVSLGYLGAIVLLTRIWDAVLDPAIGRLSDQGKLRILSGRRKSFLCAGMLPLALVVVLLFTPSVKPDFLSSEAYLFLGSLVFFFFWTFVSIPYEALGAELSSDYHERTRILSGRDGLLLLGTLAGAVLPEIFLRIFGKAEANAAFSALGVFYGILIVTSLLITLKNVPEKADGNSQQSAPAPLRSVLQNPHFMVLLLAYAVAAIGGALPASLILYYVEEVLGSSNGPMFLFLYLGTGVLFLPFWVWASRRYGKLKSWLWSLFINTFAFFWVMFLGAGDETLYGLLVFISGLGLGATLAIPSSLQADVIDYDEWLTRQRREGLYVGLWSIVKKAAQAVGAGLGFLVLDAFRGEGAAALNENYLFALRFLYAGVPSICSFLAILIAMKYQLSEIQHRQIRQEIDDRGVGNGGN